MSQPKQSNRFVTGHDENGRAVVQYEGPIPYTEFKNDAGEVAALFGVPWQTREFPADNSGTKDEVTEGGPLNNDTGTLCRIVEFPPHSSSPMHRTVSLDYGIVVLGNITLELDDGQERELVPGDICVQRGTIHAWHNRSDSWGRMVYVLVAAKPVTINGKEIGDEKINKE